MALVSSTAFRTVASRKRRRAQALVAGIHAQELDRARQPIVQARPALLDPQRDVEIVKPDDQRPDDSLESQPERRTGQSGQQCRPDHEVEVKQPIGQARQDHQRHHRADHPRKPVESQQPPE